jgi:hypothetical protein
MKRKNKEEIDTKLKNKKRQIIATDSDQIITNVNSEFIPMVIDRPVLFVAKNSIIGENVKATMKLLYDYCMLFPIVLSVL